MQIINPYAAPGLKLPRVSISPARIIKLVCLEMDITEKEFFKNTRNRRQNFVFARYIAAWFMRKECQIIIAEIGRQLNKDHSSIVHYLKQVNYAFDTQYKPLLQPIKKIQSQINTIIDHERNI